MTAPALALRQVVYENKAFWRNPPAAFFVFAFPLMFLVIFNIAFGSQPIDIRGGRATASFFIVPAIVTFSLINATFTNLALNIAFAKDAGLLKRVRGTPLPPWSFLAAKLIHAVFVMALLVFITTAAGALFYDVDVPGNTLPAVIAALVVGAASFSALGLAATAAIPNADAAPAIVNAIILPLYFVSDVFIRIQDPPAWMELLREVTPVKHLQAAFFTAYNPFVQGAGFEWGDLAVVAVWGAAGLGLAFRFFTWEPRR